MVDLAPEGMIQVAGELWRAQIAAGTNAAAVARRGW
jgi:hypothetical protein